MSRPLWSVALLALLAAPAWAQPFEERWRARVRAFEQENAALPADARTVVLVGSSSMEGWAHGDRVRRFLPAGRRYLNRGISGDGVGLGSFGVKNRLEASALGCKAGWIFLLVGQNDVGRDGARVEATARVYREVVARIRAGAPGAVLAVVTCQPTRGEYAALAPHLVALNAKLREVARDAGCPLIDLHARLVGPDGLTPRPGLSSDGLHMTDEGYRILGEEIARVLGAAAAPPPPPPPPPAPTPGGERTYVVRPGDTLARIARRHGTTTRALAALNGIADPDRILIGRRLRLPTGGLAGALPGG